MKMIISVFTKERRYNKIKDIIIKNKKLIIISVVILLLVSIDQIAKYLIVKNIYNFSIGIIPNVLNFTYIENTGGAFGIGNDSTIMFVLVNAIIIILTLKFIISKKDETYILLSLGLILAGGIGNLIDRIFRGFVVDYIDFNPIIKYPVFNIADICITTGCILIIISFIYYSVKSRREK